MRKIGKKGLQWSRIRAGLVRQFEAMGITKCEARLTGCWHDNALGFAHRLKRRHITTEEELSRVALVCNICHDKLERLSESQMSQEIDAIIARRRV